MSTDLPFPKSLPDFQRLFPDDAACAKYPEAIRCEVVPCPCSCHQRDNTGKPKPEKEETERPDVALALGEMRNRCSPGLKASKVRPRK